MFHGPITSESSGSLPSGFGFLTAAAGTITVSLGRSGCGKSTLLNLAGAMDFPGFRRGADRWPAPPRASRTPS